MAVTKREMELMEEIRRLKEDKAENEATYEKVIERLKKELAALKGAINEQN